MSRQIVTAGIMPAIRNDPTQQRVHVVISDALVGHPDVIPVLGQLIRIVDSTLVYDGGCAGADDVIAFAERYGIDVESTHWPETEPVNRTIILTAEHGSAQDEEHVRITWQHARSQNQPIIVQQLSDRTHAAPQQPAQGRLF